MSHQKEEDAAFLLFYPFINQLKKCGCSAAYSASVLCPVFMIRAISPCSVDLPLSVPSEGVCPKQQEHVEIGDIFRQAAVPSHAVNLDPSNPRQAQQDQSSLS
jgi:hypothetical protein